MPNIRVNIQMVTASGRRRSWMKIVSNVNINKTNGYAFDGDFLPSGEIDLPIGAIIVEQIPEGSVKNSYKMGRAYRIEADPDACNDNPPHWSGNRPHFREVARTDDWSRKFLSFRDAVASALNPPPAAGDERTALLKRRLEICRELVEIDKKLGFDPIDWEHELSIDNYDNTL